LVEEGWFDRPPTRLIAEEYLAPLRRDGIDALVLGCTHYPMLKPLLQSVLGAAVTLIDSAAETAAELARVLNESGLVANAADGARRWAASDDTARFSRVGALFIGAAPEPVELVDVSSAG